MALPKDLYDVDNLRRAWRWVRSNPDRGFKGYFRELYSAYSIAEDSLLHHLADKLQRGLYDPEHACKIYLPKKSGILRPYSLLSVEDQIAYQSAVNLIAEALFPRVRARYLNEVFGHLYAGKTSIWFYRKWSEGYTAFNKAATDAFMGGYGWTASFDLTACYDSIDHKVIQHFLTDLRLPREFSETLTAWLSKWTATESKILHGHGIPQGPLSSGLVAEAVLRHFDDNKWGSSGIRYMRYVDDIRLFARNEAALRGALVRLDHLSKDVGLFPQSSKIDIHKISNINEELKSISQPAEVVLRTKVLNQERIRRRLIQLSPRHSIINPTRFKYLLAHAEPNAVLTNRLWKIYSKAPDYYEPISRYLERYNSFPKKTAEAVLSAITGERLYPAIRARFLRALTGRIKEKYLRTVRRHLKQLWRPRISQADFSAALGRWLISSLNITDNQLLYAVRSGKYGWLRAQLLFEVSTENISRKLLIRLVNIGIQDPSLDSSLAAAYTAGKHSIRPSVRRADINDGAKLLLKEFGLVSRAKVATCGIEISFEKLLSWPPSINWKKFFGVEYTNAERQIIECRGYAETNASAWINGLDVFNDYLLFGLYHADASLGAYNFGNPGSVLNSIGSRLEKKYPDIFSYAKAIHNKRLESLLSHPRIRTTGKPTRQIKFSYIRTSKQMMHRALRELQGARLV